MSFLKQMGGKVPETEVVDSGGIAGMDPCNPDTEAGSKLDHIAGSVHRVLMGQKDEQGIAVLRTLSLP